MFIAAIILFLGAGMVAAANRIPWSDEGWFSSAAYNLARHGFLGTTVLEQEGSGFTRINQRTYWVMPLYLLGQALWYKLFPATVLATRAFSLFVWGLLTIFALRIFLTRLNLGSDVALLGGSLLATSFMFIDNSSFARPDVMCCALGIAGLAVYLTWREKSLYRALFASNLLIAASGLTHPNGIFHFLGLSVVVLWFDRRRLNWTAVAAAALPYLLAGAIWGCYILQDRVAFHDQMMTNGTNGRLPANFGPMSILKGEIERYMTAFGLVTRGIALSKAYALLGYLAAVVACLLTRSLRRNPGVQLLLVLLAVYFAALCVFNQKLSYYLIHILPFYIALLAVWIRWLWLNQSKFRPLIFLAVAALMAEETAGILIKAATRSYQVPQRAAVAFIRAHAGPQDRIYGSASLIYELGFDSRLCDDPYLGLKSGKVPDMVVIETLYHLLFEAWTTARPVEMEQIRERLKNYRLVYQDGDYSVYSR